MAPLAPPGSATDILRDLQYVQIIDSFKYKIHKFTCLFQISLLLYCPGRRRYSTCLYFVFLIKMGEIKPKVIIAKRLFS